MIAAWRIVKENYAASAFSGEGASRSGGRWNSHGIWVVYASSSRALAALQNLCI
jgi:RES domain-containing protein